MAQTTNPDRLIQLSAVHVTTSYAQVISAMGMRGVLLPVASDKEGLKVYRSLDDLQNDYDIDDPTWNQGERYFTGASDGALFVMTYDKNYSADSKPTVDGVKTSDNSATVTLSGTSAAKNGLLHALSKYYYGGSEYIVFPVASADDKATAVTLSNFVEAQDRGVLVLDVSTIAGQSATADDFAFLETIKANRATKVVSLQADLDAKDTMGAAALGQYVGYSIGANFKFLTNLGLTPQDQYDFTNDDLQVYEKYNVATYANENGGPMTTNGRMLSGIGFSTMVIKDSITNDIISTVSTYLKPKDSTNRVPYDSGSLKAVKGLVMGVLDKYREAALIDSYTINDPQYSDLTDEKKATGVLDVFKWTWKPMPTIDQAEFAQTLVVTDNQ